MSDLAQLVEELAVQTIEKDSEGNATGRWSDGLLSWLRDAVRGGDVTRGGGGRTASARLGINAEAFTLWEDISGRIAEMYASATDRKPYKDPEANLLTWWAVFAASAERGETVLIQHEIAYERLHKWVAAIRKHFDPPKHATVEVACPVCGLDRVTVGIGDNAVESFTLDAFLNEDGELEVHCTNPACEARWVGRQELVLLGRQSLGAVDPEKVREALQPQPSGLPTEIGTEIVYGQDVLALVMVDGDPVWLDMTQHAQRTEADVIALYGRDFKILVDLTTTPKEN